jgi:GDP-6-deoxy-D-talose 4-dehydrogenase
LAREVLITGISGFTGRHLRSALEAGGYVVHGIGPLVSHANDRAADLLDPPSLDRALSALGVEYVVHLAGVSSPAHDQPDQFRVVHEDGTRNLLEALAKRRDGLRKVILASSAYVYGQPVRSPVDESAEPAPTTPYGESKLRMERMAAQWFSRLPLLIVRPFNYTGIGQSATFVVPKLVNHFREKSRQIELGDTTVVREFLDVRDVAELYARLLECELQSDVVNLCRGIGYTLSSVIDMLRNIAGHAPDIRDAAALHRVGEMRQLVGSPQKLLEAVGKFSFRPLEQTLAWMLRGA